MSDLATQAPVNPKRTMRSILQRIATGPELSKNISREEAREGTRLILESQIDPVQAGIFLIALRMKRETDEENIGAMEAIRQATDRATAEVDELIDIADPYDGYNRTLPPAPFLPAVLAACGVPAVSHGMETAGPKYGITHRQVLRAAGVPVDLSPQAAAARIADPKVGWSYVDQSYFCPGLHRLEGLRTLIVKRPVITTVEVLAGPVQGRNKTHLMTGYVHKPYPRIYALLAREAGFDSCLLVRGVEGGVIPSLRQVGKVFQYHNGGEEHGTDVHPSTLAIKQTLRAIPVPKGLPKAALNEEGLGMEVESKAMAEAAANIGLAALAGEAGPCRDGLLYSAALCLWHLGHKNSLVAASDVVRRVLDNGQALERLRA